MSLKNLSIVFSVVLLASVASCNTDSKNADGLGDPDFEEQGTSEQVVETFYQVPSPEDLFVFVKAGNLPYNGELLNPITNVGRYIDTKSKELNFGVYTADLAYAAAFHKYQESLKKLESIRKMSDEIGISSVFDQALEERIKHIFTNSDSLMSVTSSSYYNIVDFLESNDRGKTLAMLSAGGWIESLYIVSYLVDDYDKYPKTIQHIADQKLSFENLVMYLKKYEYDENVKATLDEIMIVQEVYQSLDNVSIDSNAKTPVGDEIWVGGKSRIKMTEEQFELLKEKITIVRNKVTGNNVK